MKALTREAGGGRLPSPSSRFIVSLCRYPRVRGLTRGFSQASPLQFCNVTTIFEPLACSRRRVLVSDVFPWR